jgi:hypothetical protein
MADMEEIELPEGERLSDILTRLPANTPLFLPEELLRIWFPPWMGIGGVEQESVETAEEFGRPFNCKFTYDPNMKQWCFVKRPIVN